MPAVKAPPAKAVRKVSLDDAPILFQRYFRSVGPRTYAAQVKKAANGNHFLVLTEGKRDEKTRELRKTRLLVYSEDFREFFRMLHETAVHIREHPVPEEIKRRREKFWARQGAASAPPRSGPAARRMGMSQSAPSR